MTHGYSAYTKGCRCVVCRDAIREYQRAYRASRSPGACACGAVLDYRNKTGQCVRCFKSNKIRPCVACPDGTTTRPDGLCHKCLADIRSYRQQVDEAREAA